MINQGESEEFGFRAATAADAEHVLSLYRSVRVGEFCVWNDVYPAMTEIKHDTETKNLHLLTCGTDIVGAISIVPENELDIFPYWSDCDGEAKEIARVAVARSYQGRGISCYMLNRVIAILKNSGCRSIHLSVAKTNIPAYKTYIKAGFLTVGEADMYGNSYYLMEKAIY